MSRQRILLVAVALLAITAGCTGLDDAGDTSDERSEALEEQPTEMETDEAGLDYTARDVPDGETTRSDTDDTAMAATERPSGDVIRTAEMTLETERYERTRASLNAEASDTGGFLAGTDQRTVRHETGNGTESQTSGKLVYRIPSEEFEGFYTSVEAEGEVTHASTDTEDVSDQLVDLEARIETLEGQRDRLRTFYDEANTTEELLAIEERLGAVQSEIERLEAQRESLRDQVAYSTVTVNVSEPEPDSGPGEAESWTEQSVVGAFLTSVDGVVSAVRGTIVLVAYGTPFALAFGGPLVAGYIGFRWWRYSSDEP